jgi:probable F420-dependent oxidoreductase
MAGSAADRRRRSVVRVRLGTHLPKHLVGGDHGAMKAYLGALEDMGYSYITFGDHVLGADLSARPDWKPYFGRPPSQSLRDIQPEVFVLFGLLAGLTRTLELTTSILIAPQRQTALLAKQAAEIDILSGGRLRLVMAVGWSDVEYEALGVDYHQRGAILDEQVEVLRRLWTEHAVTFKGRFHTITAAGLNPLPSRPIPLWFGGQSPPVLRRVGRVADGWFPYYPWFSEEQLRADLDTVQAHARDVGRDPASIALEGAFYWHDERFEKPSGARGIPETLDEGIEYAHLWKDLGADRLWVTTPWAGTERGTPNSPLKIGSEDVDLRIEALRQFQEAIGPDF